MGLTACDEDTAETESEDASADTAETETVEDSDEATEVSEEPAEEEDEPSGDAGNRDNPLALGDTLEGAEWTVTLNSADLGADDEVQAENEFNEPAEEGLSFALFNVDVTYTGEDSEMIALGVGFAFVSTSGETYNDYDASAVAPNALDEMSELYTGGSESGNVVTAIPEDADGLVRISTGFIDEQEAFFAID